MEIILIFFIEKYLKIFLINNDRVILRNLVIYLYDFNITFKSRKKVIDNRIRVNTEVIINIEDINPKFISGFLREFRNRDFQRPGFRRIYINNNKNNNSNNKRNITGSSTDDNKSIKIIIE